VNKILISASDPRRRKFRDVRPPVLRTPDVGGLVDNSRRRVDYGTISTKRLLIESKMSLAITCFDLSC
jgi:hypothetical protein